MLRFFVIGVLAFLELRPHMLRRRIDHGTITSYAEMFEHLAPGQFYRGPPRSWDRDWVQANPDRFNP